MNHGLKWVLLGGDDTIVPAQACYVYCSGYTEYTPTDLFYACFDQAFNWDANGNSILGEADDNIDMYPEVYISRLPIRTKVHAKAFVNKL